MKISTCKHCGLQKNISLEPKGWMANHSRWCEQNPNRSEYVTGSEHAVNAMKLARHSSGRLNQYVAAKLDKKEVPVSPLKGLPSTFKGKTHSEKSKKIISEKGRLSTHRRLRRNMVWYNEILMDSSWEVLMAKKLDMSLIRWERPTPIPYTDSTGKIRNYFPDFYLPDYNLYLDPKNPQAYKVQFEKIECLKQQYNNIIFLRNLEEIKNFTPILALSSKQ